MPNEIVVHDQDIETGSVETSLDGDFFAPSVSSTRRAEIEAVMKTDINRYYRDGLHRELADLLKDGGEDASANSAEASGLIPLPAEQSRNELMQSEAGQQLVDNWHAQGGFEHGLRATQQAVGGLLRGIGDERAQRAFMERFDRALPEKLRFAIYDMISTGGGGFVRPADKAGLEKFARDSVGAALVREWGARAGEKVARVWQKTAYLEHACGDLSAGYEWFNTLTDREARAVLEHLAR